MGKIEIGWQSTSAYQGSVFTRPGLADNQAILYDVYMVYAENLASPVVERVSTIAKSEDDAKIKSGLMKKVDDTWDTDYLTFIVEAVGIITFKKKPTEVKMV